MIELTVYHWLVELLRACNTICRCSWDGVNVPVTFDEPGTYNITCKIHPSMNMTITVEG